MLGEKLGWHWLIYNPIQFMSFHRDGLRNAPVMARVLRQHFPGAKSCLDVGAGTGVFSAELKRLGLLVVACEHSPKGRRLAQKQGVDCRPFDLSQTPPAEVADMYDLAICFEVAEHLTPELGLALVKFLASRASLVIFTAAQTDQGGTGHINEQPRSYWIERFEREGMRFDAHKSDAIAASLKEQNLPADYLIRNMTVFERET